MAKVVSQETYDDFVKENIIEFSMTVEEAREETINQLEKSGINLGNIIKDLEVNIETGKPVLNENVEKLQELSKDAESDVNQLIGTLEVLKGQCNKSVPHRVLAAKLNLLVYVLDTIESRIENNEVLLHCAALANAMTNKNPDIFNERSLVVIKKLLETAASRQQLQLLSEVLRWLQKTCVMHENNRQMVMNSDILHELKPLLASKDEVVLREVCICLRFLILDDDVRVEFGKAHEHAKTIATETLPLLTELLKTFEGDENVIAELLLTTASLIVRNELCQVVEDYGGLKYTLDAIIRYSESPKVVREALKLLKALAGNDKVKAHIIQNGAAAVIETAFDKFKANESVAKAALACISTLALRVKENSAALFEAGVDETIIESMKIHPTNKVIQRNAAWAIRNMVSRSRDQCDSFIKYGAEDFLNEAMKNHPTIAQDCRAALRDLGCKVHLQEEWLGKSEKHISQ